VTVITLHQLANPARFGRLSRAVLPWTTAATLLLFGTGLYYTLFASPADYQMGDSVRIMYVHVPAAWMALGAYVFIAVMSAISLVWRHALADVAACAAAPIGAAFTVIVLATGSLWGRPTWGTYWEWDARMTSVLILLFIYLGYMAMQRAFDDAQRSARAAAVLALVGVIIIPVIKFSVDWWNTLHQPASVFRSGGMAIDPSMQAPLFLMALGYVFYFVTMLLVRIRADLAANRSRLLRLNAAQQVASE
jgi:heme exporter protein C